MEQERQHLERQAAEQQRAEVHKEMQRVETFGCKKWGSTCLIRQLHMIVEQKKSESWRRRHCREHLCGGTSRSR